MAGARQGWLEAPYLDTPADLNALARGAARPEGTNFAARILPGVCQRIAGHEDVMRGEETQLLGLLALRPGFEGTAILPGTHSKWVEIRDGRIIRFSTAMTGELYEILSQHSVLRHSFAAGSIDGPEIEDGIAEGMRAGLESPALATSLIFRTRAAALLSGQGRRLVLGLSLRPPRRRRDRRPPRLARRHDRPAHRLRPFRPALRRRAQTDRRR